MELPEIFDPDNKESEITVSMDFGADKRLNEFAVFDAVSKTLSLNPVNDQQVGLYRV